MNGSKNPAIGRDALEFIDSLLTPEEIAESNLRVALAWDPDFTKVTPAERLELDAAIKGIENGETVSHEAINWD